MGSASGTGLHVVGGRYRLIERLGKGGMGTVWRAHDELLSRTVAVKEVNLPQVDDVERAKLLERTRREARAAARLTHPNAVTVYDVVEEDGQPWIVLQLVDADSLADVIRSSGPLPQRRVAEIGLAVLSALEAAHAAGILHRDVKPGNVLIGHDGRVVLTDFGIATVAGDPSLTSTGLLLGAPAYIAPERARGLIPGPASDLWSLGATLYTALEGRPPFDRETSLATLTAMITEDAPRASVGGSLGDALSGLLERDPLDRLSAGEVRTLLEQARDGAGDTGAGTRVLPAPDMSATTLQTPAPAGPPLDPPADLPAAPTPGNRPRVAVALVLALVLVAAVVAGALIANRDPGSTNPAAGVGKSPPVSTAPTQPKPTPSAATSPTTPTAPGAAPAGYTMYRDPSGFSVAVPNGWRKSNQRGDASDGQFDFVDPTNSGRFLRFGSTTSPKPDPVADWESQESKLRARVSGYQRISIAKVTYRDFNAADWDFRIGSTRVKDRGFTTPTVGHAIYLSAPESQWDASMAYFEVAAATFRPASAR